MVTLLSELSHPFMNETVPFILSFPPSFFGKPESQLTCTSVGPGCARADGTLARKRTKAQVLTVRMVLLDGGNRGCGVERTRGRQSASILHHY